MLSLDAYKFASETGSEKAILWMLNLTPKIRHYVDDLDFWYASLVFCGFLMYNMALDLKERYGHTAITEDTWLECIVQYKKQIELFKKYDKVFNIEAKVEIKNLTLLSQLIQIAFNECICIKNTDLDVLEKLVTKYERKIRSSSNDRKTIGKISKLLIGLGFYHAGLFYVERKDWIQASKYLQIAFDLLKKHSNLESTATAYFYNVLHGKLNDS